MDIIPHEIRSVADALAVAKEAAPDHVLIAWLDEDDGVNIISVADGDENPTVAEVVYLCERIKLIQLGTPSPWTGPILQRPKK